MYSMFKQVTVYKVEYSELEKFLAQMFNKDIEIIPPMNDVLKSYDVHHFNPDPESFDQKYNFIQY